MSRTMSSGTSTAADRRRALSSSTSRRSCSALAIAVPPLGLAALQPRQPDLEVSALDAARDQGQDRRHLARVARVDVAPAGGAVQPAGLALDVEHGIERPDTGSPSGAVVGV